jgi:gas vesicle protein
VTVRHNLREFTERFAQALPAEVDRASVKDVKRFLGDWIRDTYKEWLEREGGGIARELERLAEEVIETTNANLRQAVDDIQEELGIGAEAIDLEVDSMTYDVGVYALGLGGLSIALLGGVLVGGLVMLAAPILAIVIKDKLDEKTRALAKEEGVKAIRAAGAGVEEELVRVIEDYGEKLKTFVESAGDRLYHQIDEALAQVSRDVDDGSCDRDALDQSAAAAQRSVDAIVAQLRDVRSRLVDPDQK